MMAKNNQVEIFNKIKDELLNRNEIDKAGNLVYSYSDYYYKIFGTVAEAEIEKKMMLFVRRAAKKFGVSIE